MLSDPLNHLPFSPPFTAWRMNENSSSQHELLSFQKRKKKTLAASTTTIDRTMHHCIGVQKKTRKKETLQLYAVVLKSSGMAIITLSLPNNIVGL